jgi:sugar phosphate isomerase/epimerase
MELKGHVKIDRWQEQYAATTVLFRENSLDEALTKIAVAGFRWVEISADGIHLDPRLNPDVSAVRSLLKELGLQVHGIHTPFRGLKIGHPNADLKESRPQVISESLAIGAAVGAGIAVVHVTCAPEALSDEAYEESKKTAIEYIEELRPQARELGITLALENLGPRPHLKRRFGSSLKELNEAFPGQDVGFCLDVGHMARNGLDIWSEIEGAGQRLISIHANSNDGVRDLHWLPTQGVPDWAEVKSALTRSGYDGRYVLEIKGSQDPDGMLRRIVEFAKADFVLHTTSRRTPALRTHWRF